MTTFPTFSVYTPSDWYWFVGDDTDNVWSSARAAFVPISDAEYGGWAETHTTPVVPDMAAVETTLRQIFPAGTPKTYAADCRYRKTSGGIVINSLSPATFTTDTISRNAMDNASAYTQTGGTVDWKMSDGTFVTLDQTQLTLLTNTVFGFVQECFTTESGLVAGIDDGSVTTLQQIDDAFAQISNVF
jgi:Domain of unknown function (DUF4376)